METLEEHDKKQEVKVLEDVLERMNEGVCFMCEYNSEECFKNCTHEYETLKKWLEQQIKEQKE